VPVKLKNHSRKISYAVISTVFLTTGLTACQQSHEKTIEGSSMVENDVRVGFFLSPKGAIAPEGLDEITIYSTQNEVIQILGSRY